jgi:hypothetical protein
VHYKNFEQVWAVILGYAAEQAKAERQKPLTSSRATDGGKKAQAQNGGTTQHRPRSTPQKSTAIHDTP